MNVQPIEKRNLRPDGLLEVYGNPFYTIQGEGPFCGRPCVFVRLAGCNLQCPGCDTEYSLPLKRRFIDPVALASIVNAEFADRGDGKKLVVVTGGEPFRQNVVPFVREMLKYHGAFIQFESNGTLAPPYLDLDFETDVSKLEGVYVVCSPKTPKVHFRFHEIACAFKYVLSHDSVDQQDGLPIAVLDHNFGTARVARIQAPFMGPIYLQPMDHGPEQSIANYDSLQAVKRSCMAYGYILQVQLHKIIGVD